jgi:hypothetical protein
LLRFCLFATEHWTDILDRQCIQIPKITRKFMTLKIDALNGGKPEI